MNAFNRLVALVQTEAVNGILSKLNPNAPTIEVPVKFPPVINGGPTKSIAELEAERQARKGNPKPTVKVYTNPADDPNYGMMGYAAAEGGAGAIVTDVVEEEQAV
jgi:hypothetical protein